MEVTSTPTMILYAIFELIVTDNKYIHLFIYYGS